MRLSSFVLFATIVLLTCVGSASKGTAAKAPAQVRRVTEKQEEAPSKQLATTTKAMEENRNARVTKKLKDLVHKSDIPDRFKVQSLMRQKVTGEDIFDKLELKNDPLSILTSPKIGLLVMFFSKLYKMNPIRENTLIYELSRRFNDGALARALVIASKSDVKVTKKVATDLLSQHYKNWLNNDDSIKDAFTTIMVDQKDYQMVASPNLDALRGYIQVYNRHNHFDITLIEALAEGFDGFDKLVKVLIDAKKHHRLRENAMHLEELVLRKFRDEKLRPQTVLGLLKLDETVEALASPEIELVTRYIRYFNEDNPKYQYSLVEEFTKMYGDAAVTDTLVRARWFQSTNDAPTLLRNELVNTWLKNKKSVEEVLALLKMEKDEDRFYKMAMLDRYRKLLAAKHPEQVTNWFTELRKAFDNDVDFAVWILSVNPDKVDWIESYLDTLFEEWYRRFTPVEINDMFRNVRPEYRFRADAIVDWYTNYYKEALSLASSPAHLRHT